MPKFTVEQMREIMDRKRNIRNATVIAHVDHGKTTLTDSLVRIAGISTKSCFTDTLKEERDRGITIKSTGVSLYFEVPDEQLPSDAEGNGYLLNLIDSPGHVDFSSEVTAALRVTDGALVIVDCIEGACAQTETVLRQALLEKVKPVLVINKLDRAILELQYDEEKLYTTIQRVIENVNVIIATYQNDQDGDSGNGEDDMQLQPDLGNVAFGSGLHAWGFTLASYARILSRQLNKDPKKLVKKLWGDNFYDPDAKKWVTTSTSPTTGKPLKRGFCQYVLEPIYKLIRSSMADEKEKVFKMLKHLDIHLNAEERELQSKALMKCVMPKFLPLAPTLQELIATHLPSPLVAQKYRVTALYTGPMDDECAKAVSECNPTGPLMIYISKMVPNNKGRFFAFGRVFSGTVTTGQTVRILGPEYEPGNTKDLYVKPIQRTCIAMGSSFENVDSVPCGNTVCLVGVDKFLIKCGTLTTSTEAHTFRTMKFSVSPVVRVAVRPKKATEITKLAEALRKLVKLDPAVQCEIDENTGEMIIAGVGKLHLDILLNSLRELSEIEIEQSPPTVNYKETVVNRSTMNCLAKSPNKHNRVWMTAEPLSDGLTEAIENDSPSSPSVSANADPKERARILADTYNWDLTEAKKIWTYGPDHIGANVLIDCTKGIQYLNETKDSFDAAFQWVTREGPLCGESMRGVRWNIMDVKLHTDAIHRGNGQIIPPARRVLSAAPLCADARLMEPVFLVEIRTDESVVGAIYNVLTRSRGHIFSQESIYGGSGVCVLKAYLPVAESFTLTEDLRGATSGHAFPQCVFDHWQLVSGDPLEQGSVAHEVAMKIRNRKGMKPEMPKVSDFIDKL